MPKLTGLLVSPGEHDNLNAALQVLKVYEGHGITLLSDVRAYRSHYTGYSHFLAGHLLVNLAAGSAHYPTQAGCYLLQRVLGDVEAD